MKSHSRPIAANLISLLLLTTLSNEPSVGNSADTVAIQQPATVHPHGTMGGGAAVHELPDGDSFRECVLQAGDNFMVVDFSAKWCGPCKMIAPIYAKMAAEQPDVTFAKVDVDENAEIAAQFQIRSMPTFVFLRHGKVLTSFGGADEGKLRQTLASVQDAAYDRLTRGTSVTVHGLKSDKHQHLNGQVGAVTRFDGTNGRYTVSVGSTILALQPANLLPVVECVLREDAGNNAGKTGRIVGIAAPGRYSVKVDGTTVDVATQDVDLPVGTVVYVDGLVGGAKYNGLFGKIEGIDVEQGRYVVQIRTQEHVKLKRSNVFAGKM